MYNPTQLQSFVTAIGEGSLSAAARRLKLTQPAVSQHLSQLEHATGLTLVVRTNKGVRPTQAGEIVLRHGQEILREMERLSDRLDAYNGKASGRLTVSTNLLFTQTIMVDVLSDLRCDYPDISVIQKPTDEFVDIEADGIDIAIRSGSPGNGSGIVRRIARLDTLLVASPTYLDQETRPHGPEELSKLNYIQYKEDPEQTHLDLLIDGQPTPAEISVAFAAQNPSLVLHAVQSGLGYARLPRFMAQEQLEAGTFEEVLPDTPSTPKGIYLLQTKHGAETLRNVVFRRHLFARIESAPHLTLTKAARLELQEPPLFSSRLDQPSLST